MSYTREDGLFAAIFRMLGDKLGVRLHPTQTEFINSMLQNPEAFGNYVVPVAVENARTYQQSRGEGRVEEANEPLRVARILTEFLYGRLDPKHTHLMVAETTENGALGIGIDPNKDYPLRGSNYYLLKQQSQERARQAFLDSRYFADDPNFRLETILADIPMKDGVSSICWKKFILGPNLSDMLRTMDFGLQNAEEEDVRLLEQLEEAFLATATRRLIYWQAHAEDLIATPKNPETVTRSYKRNLVEIVRSFGQYADVSFTEGELQRFRSALEGLNWDFVDYHKIARNLGASYRNWVVETGRLNMDYGTIIQMFTENGGKRRVNRRQIEDRLYFVDTPAKHSHVLEDPWDMDLSPEGSSVRKQAVKMIRGHYESSDMQFSDEEVLLMGIYRAYRKAYFVLTKFIPRNKQEFDAGRISKDEFEENHASYLNSLGLMLAKGQELLDRTERKIPDSDSFKVFASTLRRLSNYGNVVTVPHN